MAFTVYIIQSDRTARYYVGHAEERDDRVRQHNAGESKSTRHGIPWKLVHSEDFLTRSEATMRESKIKKSGIARYLRLINEPEKSVARSTENPVDCKMIVT